MNYADSVFLRVWCVHRHTAAAQQHHEAYPALCYLYCQVWCHALHQQLEICFHQMWHAVWRCSRSNLVSCLASVHTAWTFCHSRLCLSHMQRGLLGLGSFLCLGLTNMRKHRVSYGSTRKATLLMGVFTAPQNCHCSLFLLWWRPGRISSVTFEAHSVDSQTALLHRALHN